MIVCLFFVYFWESYLAIDLSHLDQHKLNLKFQSRSANATLSVKKFKNNTQPQTIEELIPATGAGCTQFRDEISCIFRSSLKGNQFDGQPCHWCCDENCFTNPSPPKCVPLGALSLPGAYEFSKSFNTDTCPIPPPSVPCPSCSNLPNGEIFGEICYFSFNDACQPRQENPLHPDFGNCNVGGQRCFRAEHIENCQTADACVTNADIDCSEAGSSRYRTINGRCNNVNEPLWGSSGIVFDRLVPREKLSFSGYPPVFTNAAGRVLSNARHVSHHIGAIRQDDTFETFTHFVMHMGQFLDHDLTLTPEGPNCDSECPPLPGEEDCCIYVAGGAHHGETPPGFCAPIQDLGEGNSTDERCFDFHRSTIHRCEGADETFNALTAFLDTSNVYGSTDDVASALRSFVDGKLRGNVDHAGLLPYFEAGPVPPACPASAEMHTEFQDFFAGDARVNEIPGLQSLHTLWFREHNRLADLIKASDPSYSDEYIYQEARRFVNAEYLHITYNEWLPIVLGLSGMISLGIGSGTRTQYDPSINPSLNHAFATAAFRFGHTLVSASIKMSDPVTSTFTTARLRDNFFTTQLLSEGNLNSIFAGMQVQNAEKYNSILNPDLLDFLFSPDGGTSPGGDLYTRNVQRGRDHEIGTYNAYRQHCNLDPLPGSFNDPPPDEIPASVWSAFPSVFANPDDIDLFTGGLSEESAFGAIVGPTFQCIIGRAFLKLQVGDRYFYSHNNVGDIGFSDEQFDVIRQRTMRDILCDNLPGIGKVSQNVFLVPGPFNPVLECQEAAQQTVGTAGGVGVGQLFSYS